MSVTIPSRDNRAGTDVEVAAASTWRDYPSHLTPVTDPNHDAVCDACGYWITVGPDGTEYGHARLTNGAYRDADGDRKDCPHRPTERVDP